MQKSFDAGADQKFCVRKIEHVGDRAQTELACLVGRRRKHFRRELRARAVAGIDPDFHEIGFVRGQFLHGLARLRRARHRKRDIIARGVGRPGSRIGEAAADGEDARSVRNRLRAQAERQVAHVGAGAQHRGNTVISVALDMIDVVLAREVGFRHFAADGVEEAGMAVRVDDRRHHGLAGQINACGAGRDRQLPLPANRREAVVFDDEG